MGPPLRCPLDPQRPCPGVLASVDASQGQRSRSSPCSSAPGCPWGPFHRSSCNTQKHLLGRQVRAVASGTSHCLCRDHRADPHSPSLHLSFAKEAASVRPQISSPLRGWHHIGPVVTDDPHLLTYLFTFLVLGIETRGALSLAYHGPQARNICFSLLGFI